MKTRTQIIISLAAAGLVPAAAAAAVAALAGHAGRGDSNDPAVNQARAAAAAAVPRGKPGPVVPVSDQTSTAHGVVITKPDGNPVGIIFNAAGHIVGIAPVGQGNSSAW